MTRCGEPAGGVVQLVKAPPGWEQLHSTPCQASSQGSVDAFQLVINPSSYAAEMRQDQLIQLHQQVRKHETQGNSELTGAAVQEQPASDMVCATANNVFSGKQ